MDEEREERVEDVVIESGEDRGEVGRAWSEDG